MKIKQLLVVLVALTVGSAPALAQKKGVEHFFKKPQFSAFQISPDGKNLAALAPIEDRMNIVVMDLETRQARAVTGVTSQDINGFQWANNERLLFNMDKDGSESFGLFAVNIDGSLPRTLAEPLDAQISSGSSVVRTTFVHDLLRHDKENILVVNNERRAAYPDIYEMNIYTGKKKLVERNPGNVGGWFSDWDGNVIGGGYQDELEQGFMMKDPESGEWVEWTRTRYDQPDFTPLSISGDGENGLVASRITPDGQMRDRYAVYEYNFTTRKMGDLVFEHDILDVTNVIQNLKQRKAVGLTYALGKPETVWFDERWATLQAGIDQALPDTVNNISSVDDAETVAVVTSWSDVQPPIYYLYDMEENKMEFLAESRPWIEPEDMSPMKVYSFETRDGKTMHGYITVPKGTDGENLPIVVNPHGGPWARDGWGFNPEHQFLADRGYAVLQVNFRGSTGFGLEHEMSSRKQWGQAMQNDVTDALMWAVDEGIADKDRACIYGGSYGGYATMAGLVYTPELYQCGINYVGVTDLPLLFRTAPDAWAGGLEIMEDRVGSMDDEREFLQQWSPSNHADKIQAPVFMAYGLTDPRVNIRHQRVMESAMKKADVEYETMIKTDEGHGYRKQENIYDFYGRMDTFLAEHLNP